MDLSVNLFTRRLLAIETFNNFRSKALWSFLFARLFSRPAGLSDFAQTLPELNPNRKYVGTQNIPLEQITGSVGRPNDFDCHFRPLKAHLRDRWVANYLHMQAGHTEPILVYKVGSQYFVEDGHHRVSVAHSTGMAYIQAEVWEYKPRLSPVPALPSWQPAARIVCPTASACSCKLSAQKA